MQENQLIVIEHKSLQDKIHLIRGQKVMLDMDLAEIYGYETKNFNRQVKNNIDKFDDDFRFQLTSEEFERLRCKNFTSNRGGTRYLPYAFTEQGIYMLMTVLKGELATVQSKALIRTFRKMKDFLVENQDFLTAKDITLLALQTNQNSQDIAQIKTQLAQFAAKEDLQKVMDNFIDPNTYKHFLIMNGQKIEASQAYSAIYQSAKQRIFVVDNYIGLKTLALLRIANPNVEIILFSDNSPNRDRLTSAMWQDFQQDYPDIRISLKTTEQKYHDRYIAIDYGTPNMAIYHCGASSKDAGNKITSIHRVEDAEIYLPMFEALLNNPPLILK